MPQLCIRHGLTMLTTDNDFVLAAAHCPGTIPVCSLGHIFWDRHPLFIAVTQPYLRKERTFGNGLVQEGDGGTVIRGISFFPQRCDGQPHLVSGRRGPEPVAAGAVSAGPGAV